MYQHIFSESQVTDLYSTHHHMRSVSVHSNATSSKNSLLARSALNRTRNSSSTGSAPGPGTVSVSQGHWRRYPTGTPGTNVVAIDNKIEQAMDLVKTHLMYAVREEVEVLKDKIGDLERKISRLEWENQILREHASPEILAQIQQSIAASGPTPAIMPGFISMAQPATPAPALPSKPATQEP